MANFDYNSKISEKSDEGDSESNALEDSAEFTYDEDHSDEKAFLNKIDMIQRPFNTRLNDTLNSVVMLAVPVSLNRIFLDENGMQEDFDELKRIQ